MTNPDTGAAEAEELYREAARRLADGLDETVKAWIRRVVNERLPADWSEERRRELQPAIDVVAETTHASVVPRLRALLGADVDFQAAGPLGILRDCVGPANQILADSQIPEVKRDPVAERMFPDDRYALGPANFDDVDPTLHDTGLVWGAAKAHVMLIRHRPS